MGERLSVTAVSKKLHAAGFIPAAFTARDLRKGVKGVMNETFGNDSHIFVNMGTRERRNELEAFLRRHHIAFQSDYWPSSATVDIQVTYFKGWHWDE